jgi:ankyrin repeat protein
MQSQLFSAIEANSLEQVQILLESNPEFLRDFMIARDDIDCSPLDAAVRKGNLAMVKLLVSKFGFDCLFLVSPSQKNTVAHWAANSEQGTLILQYFEKVIEEFVVMTTSMYPFIQENEMQTKQQRENNSATTNSNSNNDAFDQQQQQLQHQVIDPHHRAIIQDKIKHFLSRPNKNLSTPAHWAASSNKMKNLVYLAKSGIDILDCKDNLNQTPYDVAKAENKYEALQFLENWKWNKKKEKENESTANGLFKKAANAVVAARALASNWWSGEKS